MSAINSIERRLAEGAYNDSNINPFNNARRINTKAGDNYTKMVDFLKMGTMDHLREFSATRPTNDSKEIIRFFRTASRGANKANTTKRLLTLNMFFNAVGKIIKEGGVQERREKAVTLYDRLYRDSIESHNDLLIFLSDRIPDNGIQGSARTIHTRKVKRTKPRSHSRSPSQKGGRRNSRRARKNIPVRGFAVVQSAEKPWVKEANYRRWLTKLKRHTIKVRREGENEAPENMCVDSKLCRGDLGIPRRLMPQFTSPRDNQSFTAFAEKRYGIKSQRATRRAARLKPSQEEINRERVEDVQEDIVEKKLDPNVPLIVSRDGYVIDGHHRWAAYKSHHPGKKLPVLLVNASARDVLSVAATWGAKHHQF